MEIIVDGVPHKLLRMFHGLTYVRLVVEGIADAIRIPDHIWESGKAFRLRLSGRMVEVTEEGE